MFSKFKNLALLTFLVAGNLQAQSMPKFSVIALNKPPLTLLANSISHAQYKVTNNTTSTRTLVMQPLAGIKQLSGSNLCSYPFQLSPGQSCFLDLELNASQMTSDAGSLVICKTKAADNYDPDYLLCSEPSPQDQLSVRVLPCRDNACLPTDTATALRAVTQLYRQTLDIPGIVSGIWIPNTGNLIIEDGFADLETRRYISRLDHFRIGSVTKSFSVNILLQLIQEGLLQLSTPLSTFMPTLQNANATMGDLADMRSGIFNYTEDQNFVTTFFANLARIWLAQELVDVGNANLPYFPAGSNWHYSNTNTVIIGMIIEMLTERSMALEMHQRIFSPLHLTNTYYPYTLVMPEPYAHGYAFSPREDLTNTSPTAAAASGAMISCLEDLHVWSKALGTGQLLTPAMFAAQIASLQPMIYSPCPDNQGRGPVNCPEYNQYGYGIGELQGWIGHTGEFVGYTTLVMYHPQTGASIVILMNVSGLGEHLPVNLFKEYLAILS